MFFGLRMRREARLHSQERRNDLMMASVDTVSSSNLNMQLSSVQKKAGN